MFNEACASAEISVTHRAYRGVTDELSETTFDFMLTPHVRGQLSVGVEVFSASSPSIVWSARSANATFRDLREPT